jgi:hypothetical protein
MSDRSNVQKAEVPTGVKAESENSDRPKGGNQEIRLALRRKTRSQTGVKAKARSQTGVKVESEKSDWRKGKK